MLGAWTESFGTTRKNVGYFPPVVRSVRVAEPDTDASSGDLEEPGARDHRLARRGADDARDGRVRDELPPDGPGERGRELRVSLDDLVVRPELPVVLLRREPRPGDLLLPEERGRAGERSCETERRAAAADRGRRRGSGAGRRSARSPPPPPRRRGAQRARTRLLPSSLSPSLLGQFCVDSAASS